MSSTNHTQHYGLSQWEPEDPFLREDFNQDFRKIDGTLGEHRDSLVKKCEMVIGTYRGDGTDGRVIDIGFRPSAVLVECNNGFRAEQTALGGIFTGKFLRDQGFEVGQRYALSTNHPDRTYTYIAFR